MKRKETKTKTLINFESTPAYRDRLRGIAKILDMPYRKLITLAIDEKVERAARRNEQLKDYLEGLGS